MRLIETSSKLNGEFPELIIFKSPANNTSRYVSPMTRDIKSIPKSVREIRKQQKDKKIVVFEDFEKQKKTKEHSFEFFVKSLQNSNGIARLSNQLKTYKFYVGPGNNSELVSKMIRNRTW